MQDWSIQEVAKLAGTTSRTLRHYDDIGLLRPTRIAANGYRHYDEAALRRLQRILLLRETGLRLTGIAGVLDGTTDESAALRQHLAALQHERDLLDRRIRSVQRTITNTERKEPLMATEILDGFAHEGHRDEVTRRWGAEAFERSDRWWRGLDDDTKSGFMREVADLNAAWVDAAERGVDATSPQALELARRHVAWLAGVPGAPRADGALDPEYVTGLGEMYVADERFAANYGGVEGATLVRDALAALMAAERG